MAGRRHFYAARASERRKGRPSFRDAVPPLCRPVPPASRTRDGFGYCGSVKLSGIGWGWGRSSLGLDCRGGQKESFAGNPRATALPSVASPPLKSGLPLVPRHEAFTPFRHTSACPPGMRGSLARHRGRCREPVGPGVDSGERQKGRQRGTRPSPFLPPVARRGTPGFVLPFPSATAADHRHPEGALRPAFPAHTTRRTPLSHSRPF